MGVLSKIVGFIGGDAFKAAKDLVTEYFPPDMSPEKRLEFDIKFQDLAQQKAREAGELANTQLQLELADTQSARQAHAMSRMPAVVTIMLTVIACALLYVLGFIKIPVENQLTVTSVFGTVFTLWIGSVTYWTGTTRSSAEKSNVIAQLPPLGKS